MPSRDPADLYKDKVEVSLDGRQIFYLFFGGAVIVGMVFVLGVLVGRRVEARGHIDRAHTAASTDPLAALDRLEGNGGLSFRGALTGKDAQSDVEKQIGELEKARAAAPAVDKKKGDKAEVKKDEAKKDEAKKDAAKADKGDASEEAKAGPVVKPEPDTKKDAKKVDAKKDDAKKDDAKKDDATETKVEAKIEVKKPEEPKQRYTLQLSSFQDKAEAEAFLDTIKAQGYSPQITQAEVEGKGTFYRVRLGTYKSMETATAAKTDFEKDTKKTTSIMKL